MLIKRSICMTKMHIWDCSCKPHFSHPSHIYLFIFFGLTRTHCSAECIYRDLVECQILPLHVLVIFGNTLQKDLKGKRNTIWLYPYCIFKHVIFFKYILHTVHTIFQSMTIGDTRVLAVNQEYKRKGYLLLLLYRQHKMEPLWGNKHCFSDWFRHQLFRNS